MRRLLSLPLARSPPPCCSPPPPPPRRRSPSGRPRRRARRSTTRRLVTKIGPVEREDRARARARLRRRRGRLHAASAADLVQRVPGLQVWAVDRRSQALEDTSMFDARRSRGEATLQQVATTTSAGSRNPTDPAALHAAEHRSRWRSPRTGACRPRSATCATSSARRAAPGQARDPRRALARRVDGGDLRHLGLQRAPGLPRRRRHRAHRRRRARDVRRRRRVAQLRKRARPLVRKQPFADLVGLGLPWAQGVFAGLGAACTRCGRRPSARRSVDDPLLPPCSARRSRRRTGRCSATRSTRRRRRRRSRSSTCAPAAWRRAATRATG